MKIMKRNKRKFERERMHENLMADYENSLHNDEKTKINKKENRLTSDLEEQFEDNLNKFLGINIKDRNKGNNKDKTINISENEGSDEEPGTYFNSNRVEINHNMPIEETKSRLESTLTSNINNSKSLNNSQNRSPDSYTKIGSFKISPAPPIERTISQEAEELGILSRKALKQAQSNSDKSMSKLSRSRVNPSKRKKNKFKTSQPIHEVSSDEEAKEYEHIKRDYLNHERLFIRKQAPVERSVSLLDANDAGFNRIDRVKQNNSMRKQQIMEDSQLVVDFDDGIFEKTIPQASEGDESRCQLIEPFDDKKQTKLSNESLEDEESLDERVDF